MSNQLKQVLLMAKCLLYLLFITEYILSNCLYCSIFLDQLIHLLMHHVPTIKAAKLIKFLRRQKNVKNERRVPFAHVFTV